MALLRLIPPSWRGRRAHNLVKIFFLTIKKFHNDAFAIAPFNIFHYLYKELSPRHTLTSQSVVEYVKFQFEDLEFVCVWGARKSFPKRI